MTHRAVTSELVSEVAHVTLRARQYPLATWRFIIFSGLFLGQLALVVLHAHVLSHVGACLAVVAVLPLGFLATEATIRLDHSSVRLEGWSERGWPPPPPYDDSDSSPRRHGPRGGDDKWAFILYHDLH